MNHKKHILVTGGAGFIGFHLCKRFLKEENYVYCIDNFISSNEDNIRLLQKYKNFSFLHYNIANPFEDLLYICNMFTHLDEIYHLACPASPKYYQQNPILTLETCFIGTSNMLKLAKKYNAKILFTSTSEIYGEPLEHPQTEEYRGNVNTFGPRSCYDEGKRVAESIIYAFKNTTKNSANNKIEVKIARIFNTYGPNMLINDGRVVYNFIKQCLTNSPITIYGDGEQTRSFCFVSDTVDGLIKLMNSEHNTPINIGNPHEITIKYLADTIKNLTDSNSEVIFKDLPIDDPTRRCPNINKAKTLLGWEPKISIIEGLIETIYYCKKKNL